MRKLVKILVSAFFVFTISVLMFLNIKIETGPNLQYNEEVIEDVVLQLNFLEKEIKSANLAYRMQTYFPEGFVFTNALYGLSWCEVATNNYCDSALKARALSEAQYAYEQIDSEYAKSIFSLSLEPDYGIFYRGWKNYLLAKIVAAKDNIDSTNIIHFTTQCDEIAKAFENSKTPYLESYTNSTWPADAFLAVASLKLYDKHITERYKSVIDNWIEKVKSQLDPKTLLIPHSTVAHTGETIEGARGSSLSLMLRLLAEIDSKFAYKQFQIYNENFQITRFGIPAIREYPKGSNGKGDIDSGPVIFDVGFAGTIVAIGTYKIFGEYQTANTLSSTMEAFGFSQTSQKEKKYIFGQLAIADVFICWSKVSAENTEITDLQGKNNFSQGSKLLFHIYSGIGIFLLMLLLFLIIRMRN